MGVHQHVQDIFEGHYRPKVPYGKQMLIDRWTIIFQRGLLVILYYAPLIDDRLG